MFNIEKKIGWETFWDSVKVTWDPTFVDALGPRDAIEIKPKSNTDVALNRILFYSPVPSFLGYHKASVPFVISFQFENTLIDK